MRQLVPLMWVALCLGCSSVVFFGTDANEGEGGVGGGGVGGGGGDIITGGGGSYCFAPGTPVATPDGDRTIETLAVGDLVWAMAMF